MEEITRRELMRLAGLSAAAMALNGCAFGSARRGEVVIDPLVDFGPIQRNLGDVAPKDFSGDYFPELAHKMLWDKRGYVSDYHGGLWPASEETVEVAIVGGGMSGLLTAYALKDLSPVVLERHPRFGGNSRGESWRGLDYSLATAYFVVPEPGSPIQKFFSEIGLDKIYRVRAVNDPVFIDGVRYDDIWNKGTVPESRAQFRKFEAHLQDVLNEKNGQKYPDIPIEDPKDRARIAALDKISFMDYLKKVLGPNIHPHVERVVEHYFWSASASSAYEISAAGGLNFFAADFGSMAVTPGGNGAIAEATLKKLTETLPAGRLRPGSAVLDVKTDTGGSTVTYVDSKGKLRALRAKSVVMSCPKFVAAKVMDDLEPARRQAIGKLRYRSYIVGNLLLNHPIKDDFYDLFFFSKAQMAEKDTRLAALKQRATDVVYGNFAKVDANRTVLTLFRGFPYEGARSALYQAGSYKDFRKEMEDQIHSTVLPMLGVKPEAVVDLRLARWGHPLPLNAKGLIADGTIDKIRAPFKKRVFFVEQDNWMLPAFETCFFEAGYWAEEVRKAVKAS
jgi:protoporphyrinogen oxidase